MKIWYGRVALLISVSLILISCAGGISKQALSKVTYSGSFEQVQQDPEKYKGEIVMWGGKIILVKTNDKFTELSVLQLALGSQNRPKEEDISQGRFLVRSTQFMDPAIYSQGTLITVVGTLIGFETRMIGEMPYQYPVVEVIEAKKWQPRADSPPRLHIGVGVGTHF